MGTTTKVTVKRGKIDPFSHDVLRELKKGVLIGIAADSPARTAEPGEAQPPSNAVIGYLMETGAMERNLPARPFLVPGVAAIQDQIATRLAKGAAAAFAGDLSAPEKALHAIGLIGADAVRAKMDAGPFVALSERTLAARKARGVTRDKPLIDTGELRRSINYVIRKA